ncbi:MAG: UDP-N-acetylmuramate--L-alanine ligase [Phycisphaeraceae bacterium JB051]
MSEISSDQQAMELAGQHLHFVGIGGCGMSGLARIVRGRGAHCTGSDMTDTDVTQALIADGIPVVLQQTAESVPADCDMLVISAAIKADHPEVREANRRNLPVIKYAQLLGRLMIGHAGIAIAGTHGKSTTTSMLCHLLIQSELDPSFIVGATCAQIGGGSRVGKSDMLVAEACEFDRSFHNFHPTHAAILNVEEDHLDIYKNLDDIIDAFHVFAQKLPEHGSLLIHHDVRTRIAAGLDCDVQTIGFAPLADWQVLVNGSSVVLKEHGSPVAQWQNPMPGEHMAYNAAVAMVLAHQRGAAWSKLVSAIESFRGLDRRMQVLGDVKLESGKVKVIDDYGHHPTEIDTTLRALKRHYQPKRLICIFQPHQHSRTRFLLDQFATSFSAADMVIVPEIYFVRDSEAERQSVSSRDLVERLQKKNIDAQQLDPFEKITDHLAWIARDGDLIVTMGAGPVWKVSHALMSK